MKTYKFFSIILLVTLLASCAPVTSVPPSTLAQATQPYAATTQPATVTPWPGLQDGWMTFSSSSPVMKAVFDKSGYIWGLRRSGVLRWSVQSGEVSQFQFSDKTLPFIVQNMELYNGEVWIGSSDGRLAVFTDNHWELQLVNVGTLYSVLETGGELWLSGKNGVFYFDGKQWKKLDPLDNEDKIASKQIVKSKDGLIWFLSYSYEVRSYDGSTWKTYPNLEGVNSMIVTSDGTLWFVFYDLIVSYNEGNFKPLTLDDRYFKYTILNRFLTPDKNTIFQTNFGWFLLTNQMVQKITPPDFLVSGRLFQSGVTDAGWIFSDAKNLQVYENEKWQVYTAPQDAPITHIINNIIIGFDPKGILWTVNGQHIVGFNGVDTLSPPIDDYPVFELANIDTYGGIWYSNTLYRTIFGNSIGRVFQLNDYFTDFDTDKRGNVWVLLEDGDIGKFSYKEYQEKPNTDLVYYWNHVVSVTLEKIKFEPEIRRSDFAMAEIETDSNDGVWVILRQRTYMYLYDGEAWTTVGVPQPIVSYSIKSKDQIWVGTSGNLYKYDGKNWTEYKREGLYPVSLVVAPDNSVWISDLTSNSVYRFDGQNWKQFTSTDGLPGGSVSKILVAPDGALWFFALSDWARYKP